VFGYVLFVSAPHVFAPSKGRERLLMTAFWAAALAYVVHLFFGLSVTGSTVLLWFCFAILLSPTAETTEISPPSWGAVAGVAALLVCSAGFIYNILYVQADGHYLKARIGGGLGPVGEVKAALALNPWNDMYVAELGIAYQNEMNTYVQQAQSGNNQQAAQQAKDAFVNAEAAMRRAIAFVPTEYDNYVFLASLYNQAGVYFDRAYFDRAVEVATKGGQVEPYGPAIRFQQALAYQYLGQLDTAIDVAMKASAMDPAYADPKMLLADIYKRKGDLPKAKQYYEAALKVAAEFQKATIQEQIQSLEASMKAGTNATTTK
jgi:tetratricopeptide (TPR) repeat protein